MITRIGKISVPVTDLDAAERFFVDVLGMEKRCDEPLGSLGRWIELAPPESDIPLVPYTWWDQLDDRPGGASRIVLECEDITTVYETLRGHGVTFDEPPETGIGGIFAAFRDPFGNRYTLKQELPAMPDAGGSAPKGRGELRDQPQRSRG
ncbi:VOC family protein [Streptomyces sp. 4N124]|uniref:VOC family protein n=1 Tax=Streptomyces sp. 4N124 TaxID=3457420 RepID=UPI003FD17CC1